MADKTDLEMGKTFTSLVRIHEANCQIDYPSEGEQNFRFAVMKKLASELGLTELKDKTISGQGVGRQTTPPKQGSR
jgi:hypothetical protein